MAKKTKRNPLENLVIEIKKWQSDFPLNSNSVLESFLVDLEKGENLNYWAETEAEQILPNLTKKFQTTFSGRLRLISSLIILRNILVFAPVALTWASISVVTSAFARFENANPNAVVNFLEFWQKGFGFISGYWRLSNVALADVFLVVAIILLTFFVNFSNQVMSKIEIEENEKFQGRRLHLINRIREALYEYRKPTTLILNQNTYSAIKTLNASVISLNKIVRQLERDIKKYPKSDKLLAEIKNTNKNIAKLKNKK